MFNLHVSGGISFTKGCYLGQEIVARMQYRGELKRRLHRGSASAPVQENQTILDANGKSAGAIVTAAGQSFLAVIHRRDDNTEGYTTGDGSPVSITDLYPDQQI